MSRKLEELFNLESAKAIKQSQSEDEIFEEEDEPEVVSKAITVQKNKLAHIEAAMPAVKELELIDSELDAIAAKAMESFEDLSDLAMNVDSRFASEIFSVASNMLNHALTAKTAKATRKLKTIELQMKKAKLEFDLQKQPSSKSAEPLPNSPEEAEGRVLSRNELMAMLNDNRDSSSPEF